jgi:hypothetical protein
MKYLKIFVEASFITAMGIVLSPQTDKLSHQIVQYRTYFTKPYSYFLIFRKKKPTTILVLVEIGKFFTVFRICNIVY